jgi:hypothetical protein
MRVRPGTDDLTQDGEAAKTGVEDEYRWRNCHARS